MQSKTAKWDNYCFPVSCSRNGSKILPVLRLMTFECDRLASLDKLDPCCMGTKIDIMPNGSETEEEFHNSPLIQTNVDETMEMNGSVPRKTESEPISEPLVGIGDSESRDKMFNNVIFGDKRKKMWQFFEDPTSSVPAKIFGFISVFFILLSLVGLVISSLSMFQDENGEPKTGLFAIESLCIGWFTFEYISRLLITPQRLAFVRETMNIIDLLSIIPFYLELTMHILDFSLEQLEKITGLLLMLRILRVLRVARVFKLARHSSNLQSFGATMKASKQEIVMLASYLCSTVLLFSTVMYYFEKDDPNTTFTSIPAGFWWCIVTMTTVGYGDMIPVTIGGKLFASIATVSGVIVLAFPITMIVSNFGKLQHKSIKPKEDEKPQHLIVKSVAIV